MSPVTILGNGDLWTAWNDGHVTTNGAVAWRDDAETWAVGFTTDGPQIKPLAMRYNGADWTAAKTDIDGASAIPTRVARISGPKWPLLGR